MSAKRFKFVSPGIFINEIDNSQLPRERAPVGPVVIGRLNQGPGLRPVTVQSFSEFVEVFGSPEAGGTGDDVWRNGNTLAPTYAAYAAQAYLRNAGPVTVVRAMGEEHPQATDAGKAGWKMGSHVASTTTPASAGGVYGLFLFSSGSQKYTQSPVYGDPLLVPGHGATRTAHKGGGLGANFTNSTGSLAAVWYFDQGGLVLSGNLLPNVTLSEDLSTDTQRTKAALNGVGIRAAATGDYEFSALLYDKTNTAPKKVTFNFNRNSDRYIRKVFNTNPTLLGDSSTLNKQLGYFLGESFDRSVKDLHGGNLNNGAGTGDETLHGVIMALDNGTLDWGLNQRANQPSKTGWFIGQDLTDDYATFDAAKQQKLFRFCSLYDGDWSSKNIKISIHDHRSPTDVNPYGSFSVLIRRVSDSDAAPVVLERFSNCNLNPNSANYIARKIGDQYQEWDSVENRYRVYNQYANQSSFIRVVMDADVDAGMTDSAFLPWGVWGPPKWKSLKLSGLDFAERLPGGLYKDGAGLDTPGNAISGSYVTRKPTALGATTGIITVISSSEGAEDNRTLGLRFTSADASLVPLKTHSFFGCFQTGSTNLIAGIPHATGSAANGDQDRVTITFPSLPLRVSSSDEGLQDQKKAFFGVSTYRAPNSTRFDESYRDLVSGYQGQSNNVYDPATGQEPQFIFTLDDVVAGGSTDGRAPTVSPAATSLSTTFYHSGSRQQNESYTAKQRNYTDLIKSGFTGFTSPMFGGHDGLDIKEREPFGDHVLSGKTFKNSSAAFSLKRAIDSIQDPEAVEMNIATVPGVRAPLITNHLLSVVEDRADAIAIIDPEKGGYQPTTETKSDFKTRVTNNSVRLAVDAMDQRGLDTSYGCAYYPWVKIYDEINDKQVWVPPSVVALGTFASTQARSELWFAPAGFTRGGLTEGSAGLPVLGVSQRLSAKDRDDLYESNINPIAQFPAEGIVIFGQKTLQVTPSALDRINVRRLMVFLKKQISIISSRLIFDQNVQATWNRFRGQVEPFLEGVKARLGLVDFRVILDDTTTTPELIDRNIMYAKIFLKPARSIEFIAIDFVITNSGASFDD